MASVNSLTANVALAAPTPIPDADLEDVLGAVQTAAEILLDDLGDLPDDVAQFVQNVAEFPQSLPLEVVKLVNARIDAVQLAGRTVGLTVFGTLPEDLRAPAAALPFAIEGVIDDVQDTVEDAATPTPQPLQAATQAGGGPQLQRLSGTGLDQKDQADDPGVPPKKPRGPLVNILKHNPLNKGGDGATVNGQQAADDDESAADTGTTGKRPLRDLVKRFTGGGAQDAEDNDEGDDGGDAGESATG